MNKKKISKFYIIYFSMIFLFIIALITFIISLNSWLRSYELSQPIYKAEDIFNIYYNSRDYLKLYEESTEKISPYETAVHYSDYMKSNHNDKEMSFYSVPAGMGDKHKYCVKIGDEKISEFVISKNPESENITDKWILDEIKCIYKQIEPLKVSVMTGSTLYINGIEVSRDLIKESKIETESCSHMPEGVSGITYEEYEIPGLITQPDIKVTDADGIESTVEYDQNKNMYRAAVNYSESLKADMSELAVKAAQSYAKYMTQDNYLGNLKCYFDVNSKIYNYIRTAETWCYTPHNSYEFKDVNISEFYSYSDEVFSCRYSANQYIYRTVETHVFPIDITLYFKKIDDGFYVYDMVTNG